MNILLACLVGVAGIAMMRGIQYVAIRNEERLYYK